MHEEDAIGASFEDAALESGALRSKANNNFPFVKVDSEAHRDPLSVTP